MLVQFWTNVSDVGPALIQHYANVSLHTDLFNTLRYYLMPSQGTVYLYTTTDHTLWYLQYKILQYSYSCIIVFL